MIQTWVYWTITITIPLDVYFYIIFLFSILIFHHPLPLVIRCAMLLLLYILDIRRPVFLWKYRNTISGTVLHFVCVQFPFPIYIRCSRAYLTVCLCPWVCFVSWCDDMASISSTLCSSFWFGCNISRKSHLPPLTVRPLLYIHHFAAMTEHWEWSS